MAPGANTNNRVATVLNVPPSSVYPTMPGLSLGLQPSRAGDALLDPVSSFMQGMGRTVASTGFAAMPGARVPTGATGGQNSQVNDAMNASGMRGGYTAPQNAAGNTGAGAGTGPGSGGEAQGGFVANPVTWVIVMLVLVVATITLAHKTGKTEEFSNIRGSFYNVFYVAFVAILGILMLKAIFGRFKVPGLSDAFAAV